MGRVFRETEAQLDIVAIGNQTYYPLVYTDTLGIPFRSIHTICDELEHVNTVTDPNAGLQPWAWNYLERSFPKLDYPERNAKLVGETRYDFPLDSNVVSPLVATVDPAVLHPQVNAALQGFDNRTAGRVTAQKVFGENGELLEITLLDYDNEGRLTTMLKQFDPVGITATRFGRADAVRYPAYNLNGTVKQQDTDIGCDGRADFSQLFDYDAWGRLETVRVRHGRGTDKVAKCLYNDGLGLLRGVIHYANADSNGNCPLTTLPADTILYSYDQQDRLTGFGSRFLDYGLAYDATNVNYLGGANPTGAAVVNTSQNWAGGINGWKAKYKVTASGVTGFDGATVYGFQYDGLHRLVAADAAVMEQPFTGQNGWNNGSGFGTPLIATRAAWYGDEKYAYDKVGNLTGLRRYKYYAPGAPTPGLVGDNWKYQYTQGTNRLAKLQTAGMQDIRFTYDGNGNLLTDSKKGITVTQMGRNDLPTEMTFSGGGTVKYRHGDGGRVYKNVLGPNGTSVEYYLRDAGGAPLGVFSQLDSTWTFQIYGLDLIGEMAIKAQGDSVARYANQDSVAPSAPIADVRTGRDLSVPKRVVKNVILGLAIGIQQSLTLQNHPEERPKFLDQISTFLVPILATVADAVVDGLSPAPEPASLPPAEPETSQPDTTAYPTIKFFVKDHLGNVRVAYKTSINDTTCLVDRKVVAVMDYSPYGGLLRAWFEGDPEKWQSTGHERDIESGWDFRGARLYDANYGRFLSRDPLGGMYPAWSPYNYVLGNPVSLTDPTGMSAEEGGDEYLYEVADDGSPIVAMMDVRIWEPAGWATTKDLPRRTSVAYRDVKSTISASWEEHDTGLAEAIGRSLFAHQQRNYDAYKWVQGAMEVGGQTMGNFVGDFHPAMGVIKMSTGADEITATNIAFAALGLVGLGEANAGKNAAKAALTHVDLVTDPFRRTNFRRNLMKWTGHAGIGSDAHHIFPKAQEFADFFSRVGINVHTPRFMAWWESVGHRANAIDYNAAWRVFRRDNPNATFEEIMDQGRAIMSQFGQNTNF